MTYNGDRCELTTEKRRAVERKGRLGCLLLLIVVVASLVYFAVPPFANARQKALTFESIGKLKQIGRAMLLYSQDSDGRFPPAVQWTQRLYPRYVETTETFRSPWHRSIDRVADTPCATRLGVTGLGGRPLRGGYAVACGTLGGPSGRALATIDRPASAILAYESLGGCVYASRAACGCPDQATHGGLDYGVDWTNSEAPGAVFLFADGHVYWWKRGTLTSRNDDLATP